MRIFRARDSVWLTGSTQKQEAVSSSLTPILFTTPKRKVVFDLEESGQGNLSEEPCVAGGEREREQGWLDAQWWWGQTGRHERHA